jgi:putative MATE family efflux protein
VVRPEEQATRPADPRADEASRRAEHDSAVRQVEVDLEELGDPEASPGLPSGTLAAHSAVAGRLEFEPGTGEAGAERRELLRLAWPVMLTMGLATVGNMVDRAMIGWLDGGKGAAQALAGAAYATQFFFLIQSALFAIGLACVALMARAIGSRDVERARVALAATLQVAVAVTVALTGLFFAFARQGLTLLGAEPAVIDVSLPYLYLLLSSTVLLAFCLVIDSALRANRNMLTPMRVAAGITGVKLAGNGVLIYGLLGFPAMGLTGAGLASLISQLCGVVLFGLALRREAESSPVRLERAAWLRAGGLRPEVVRIALPGVAERLVMSGAQLAFFGVLSHHYGTVAIAAYALGVPLLSFTWIPGQGYAQAAATLVGHALGERNPARALRIGWAASGLALLTAVAVGVPVALGREALAALFTGDPAIVAALGPFLLVLACAQPFLQLHFTLGGAHRGAGDTTTPLMAATASNFLRLSLAWVAAALLDLPVIWVWGAILVDHLFRATFLLVTYRRGRWLRTLETLETP